MLSEYGIFSTGTSISPPPIKIHHLRPFDYSIRRSSSQGSFHSRKKFSMSNRHQVSQQRQNESQKNNGISDRFIRQSSNLAPNMNREQNRGKQQERQSNVFNQLCEEQVRDNPIEDLQKLHTESIEMLRRNKVNISTIPSFDISSSFVQKLQAAADQIKRLNNLLLIKIQTIKTLQQQNQKLTSYSYSKLKTKRNAYKACDGDLVDDDELSERIEVLIKQNRRLEGELRKLNGLCKKRILMLKGNFNQKLQGTYDILSFLQDQIQQMRKTQLSSLKQLQSAYIPRQLHSQAHHFIQSLQRKCRAKDTEIQLLDSKILSVQSQQLFNNNHRVQFLKAKYEALLVQNQMELDTNGL